MTLLKRAWLIRMVYKLAYRQRAEGFLALDRPRMLGLGIEITGLLGTLSRRSRLLRKPKSADSESRKQSTGIHLMDR